MLQSPLDEFYKGISYYIDPGSGLLVTNITLRVYSSLQGKPLQRTKEEEEAFTKAVKHNSEVTMIEAMREVVEAWDQRKK